MQADTPKLALRPSPSFPERHTDTQTPTTAAEARLNRRDEEELKTKPRTSSRGVSFVLRSAMSVWKDELKKHFSCIHTVTDLQTKPAHLI